MIEIKKLSCNQRTSLVTVELFMRRVERLDEKLRLTNTTDRQRFSYRNGWILHIARNDMQRASWRAKPHWR
jgi:hypothetical protein